MSYPARESSDTSLALRSPAARNRRIFAMRHSRSASACAHGSYLVGERILTVSDVRRAAIMASGTAITKYAISAAIAVA
jgi:hypothetical protein